MAEREKIRIFHTGDVHLDTPFSRLDPEKGAMRRQGLRTVFSSMMMAARRAHTNLVLISGDLFDVGYVGEDTVHFLCSEFEKAPECRFVIAPGNHDPYTANSVYRLKTFPPNVFLFRKPELEAIRFPEIGVTVWGWAFCGDKLEDNPLRDRRAEADGNLPLLCCHCDLRSASSPYAPVSAADIERFGAAYSALGHVHRMSLTKLPDGRAYGYCGCPEGRSFDEPGLGGGICAEIRQTDNGYEVQTQFLSFAERRYETETVDLCGVLYRSEAVDRIRAVLREKGYGNMTSLRLKLEGMTGSGVGSLEKLRAEDLGVFYLETEDRTSPTFDEELLVADMTLRGAFYRILSPMLHSEDENERTRARDALRMGLSAMTSADTGR